MIFCGRAKRSTRWLYFGALIATASCNLATAEEMAGVHRSEQAAQASQDQHPKPAPTGKAFDANEFSIRLVTLTHDWLANKLSTAGTSAEMREIKRERRGSDLLVAYHVFVKGAPKDQLYELQQWPTNAEKPFVTGQGLSIASDGLVMSQNHDVNFAFHPAKGEPYRLVLLSADGSTKIYFGVIPDPIIGEDRGCTLEAVGLLPKFPLVMIRAKGYKPSEELQFASKSYDEAHDIQVKSDADGEFVTAVLPKVKNKPTGKTDVTLKGAGCAPTLSFEWGK